MIPAEPPCAPGPLLDPRHDTAFVGLGSNVGDRLGWLRAATEALARCPGVELVARSPIYESHPLGPAGGPFLNAGLALRSTLGPDALLELCLTIEGRLGRIRGLRWGPRTIDLDLVAAWSKGREQARATDRLTVPHPQATRRDFVLRPLADLDPDAPLAGRPPTAWLATLTAAQRTIFAAVAAEL